MATRLVLVPEEEGATYGRVTPAKANGSTITYGLSVGTWSLGSNGNVLIDLNKDIDTITHEIATSKGVRAELRQADKDAKGMEKKTIIILDPKTKRFKQEYL